MKRQLVRSATFIRAAKKAVKKQPQVIEDIRTALKLLAEDTIHPKLKTHKLKGKLEGSWACSAGYDLRIIFNLENTRIGRRFSLKQLEPTRKFID